MVSTRTKNTPEDWKRTRFCAHTHTHKSKGTRTHCCFVSSARVDRSISPGPSSLFGWLAVVSLDRYERDRHRDRFFSDRNFFDARCTAIFPSALRSIQNALEAKKTPNKLSTRARENTQKTHREKKKKKKKKKKRNNDAPVYCSTSDFTHPSNPSSNVSKNAAPSTSRLALDADADDANAATVVAHAIVFFKPQYVLLFLPPPPMMMMMMMMCHVRVRFYIERESFEEILIGL